MSIPVPEKDSDSCDNLPPARLPSLPPPISFSRWPSPSHPSSVLSQPNSRKLCVRHQRIADEGTNLKLQQVCSPVLFPFSESSSSPSSRAAASSGAHYITTVS